MTDIVERLRTPPGPEQTITQNYRMMVEERAEAAAEIERLQLICSDTIKHLEQAEAEIERLQAALQKIADKADDAMAVHVACEALEPKP